MKPSVLNTKFVKIRDFCFFVREGSSCRDEGVDCVPRKTGCSGFKEFRVVGKCDTYNACNSVRGVKEGDICRPYLFRYSINNQVVEPTQGFEFITFNYLFNYIEFESILAVEITQILESIPGIPGILGSDKKPHF